MKQKELVEKLKEDLRAHIAESDEPEEYEKQVEKAETVGDIAYICRDLCWDVEAFLRWCLDQVLEDKVGGDIPLDGWST